MKSKKLNKHIDFDKEGITFPNKDRLWDGIEPFLLTDNLYREKNRQHLLKGIEELPVIHPAKNIWFSVSGEIGKHKTIHNRKLMMRWVAGVAAALLLGFILSPFFIGSRENGNPQSINSAMQCGEDLQVNEFLTQICLTYPSKCTNTDFLELKGEILKLQLEKDELKKQVFYNTEDAAINDLCNRIDEQITFLKGQMESYVSL